MSERFYINLPLGLGPLTLDGPEAHHLATVCRYRPGDEVCLFNGDGREYRARVTLAERRVLSLEILDALAVNRELPFPLEVAAPMPKGDRGQFLVEKLTELGVGKFVPLICRHSIVHPREARREKLERYVIEASKQCGRNMLMQIEEPASWENYAVRGQAEFRILAHPYPAGKPGAARFQRAEPGSLIRITVGPEGGFTDEEVALAMQHGWQIVTLGPRILRIETAALALAAQAIASHADSAK